MYIQWDFIPHLRGKNETVKFARKWIGLENIKLVEAAQAQKEKRHLLPLSMTILALNFYILIVKLVCECL